MKRGALKKTRRGAVATGASASGATAVGAASLGAMALGAVALGALAVGALAIGRLRVGRARLGRVEIDELAVGRLAIGADAAGHMTAVARVRTAAGEGDALGRHLSDRMAGSGPASLLRHALRSEADPDLFLFCASYADEAAFERHAQADAFNAFLRHAVEQGVVLAAGGAPAEVVLYRRF